MKRLVIVLPLLLWMVCGCIPSRRRGPAALRPFTSAEQLKRHVANQYGAGASSALLLLLEGLFAMSAAAPDLEGAAPAAGDAAEIGFSTTNIQEPGVDESDVVKTDGTYLYVVTQDTLQVVQAVPPAEMSLVGQLALDLPGRDMYLLDNKAVILSDMPYLFYYDGPFPLLADAGDGQEPWLDDGEWFNVDIVDVSDPANLTFAKRYSFEGYLVDSRMIGSRLFLVIGYVPYFAYNTTPRAIRDMDLDEILPKYRAVNANGAESIGLIADWSDFYYPVDGEGCDFVVVVTLDLADLDRQPAAVGMIGWAETIYASAEALYVANGFYEGSWFGPSEEKTDIHKFDLNGDEAEYVASGRISGYLLDQFSLSEKDGFLRVATAGWEQNNLYILEQVGSSLALAGQIEDIAPGEDLYAARFVGDKGFLVTFLRVDPLISVDLSDPHHPRIAGALEVPGYATHIHPLDDNHLLTIGRDVDELTGRQEGLTLSIFDVTELADPVLMHREVIGAYPTDSEAMWNHKAMTFMDGLMALPVELYEQADSGDAWWNSEYAFTALYIYRVSADGGFDRLGRIVTAAQYGWDVFTRGVFLGQHVYATTAKGVQAAAIDDADQVIGSVLYP